MLQRLDSVEEPEVEHVHIRTVWGLAAQADVESIGASSLEELIIVLEQMGLTLSSWRKIAGQRSNVAIAI